MKLPLTALALLLMSGVVKATDIKFEWTFDTTTTTCEDGVSPVAKCPLTGFEIQEKDKTGIWVLKEGVSPNTRSRTYTGVALGETKCYRVRANSNGSMSAPTAESCTTVSIAPRAPTNPKTTVLISVTVE